MSGQELGCFGWEEKGVSASEAMEIVLDILAPMEVTETVPEKYQIPKETADAMLAIMREEVHRIVENT